AVSRAKDSFIVIGNVDALDPSANTPSALPGRFLRARAGNALFLRAEPEVPKVRPTGRTSVSLIHTLDGHRQALADALMEAKSQVVIVSAQVSIAALRAD